MLNRLNRFTPHVVLVASTLVMASWLYDLPILRGQIDPAAAVSMKWSTALSFALLAGSHLLLRRHTLGRSILAATLATLAGVVTFTMGVLTYSAFTGDADLAVQIGVVSGDRGFQTVAPGVPSVGTMAVFTLLGFWTYLHALSPEMARPLRWFAIVAGVAALVATAGHLIGVPLLYYYIPGVSTAMALETSSLFLLLAFNARWLDQKHGQPSESE